MNLPLVVILVLQIFFYMLDLGPLLELRQTPATLFTVAKNCFFFSKNELEHYF